MNASQPRPGANPRMSLVQKLCRNLTRSFPVIAICVQPERSIKAVAVRAAAYSSDGSPKCSHRVGLAGVFSGLAPGAFGVASFRLFFTRRFQRSLRLTGDAHVVDAELSGRAVEPHADNSLAGPG